MTDEQRLSEIDPEQLVQVRRLTEARRVLSEALERLRQGVRDSQDVIEEVEGDLLAALNRVPPRGGEEPFSLMDSLKERLNYCDKCGRSDAVGDTGARGAGQ